jgi:hypothetical protein
MNVAVEKRVATSHLTVETFQDLSGVADLIGLPNEAHFVSAGPSIDSQLLFEDTQGPVALAKER